MSLCSNHDPPLVWQSAEDEDAAYFESLSAFVSKVRGEPFPRTAAHNMTFKDVARNVEVRRCSARGRALLRGSVCCWRCD